jgi:hypothetical protein
VRCGCRLSARHLDDRAVRERRQAPEAAILCVFAFSAGWSIAYLVHTLRVFGRVEPERLRAILLATNPEGRFGRIGAILSGTGPTIAVQWSIIAIAAVLVFTLWPGLEAEPVTVIFSILVVGASWAVTVVAYAVHYARFDAAEGGFEFPGKGHDRLFADYSRSPSTPSSSRC